MSTAAKPTPQEIAKFRKESCALAQQIYDALRGTHNACVVLEALTMLHRHAVSQLPPDAVYNVANQLAGYAGELLHHALNKTPVGSNHPIH
ncbi:hypothetical protein G7047_19000 [Diaphorobacter sp. HDW4A]|uniref:hypothetical protein n=1 Tax=Diaphorobacter sp. HDW4A TaxID=2714924 RepID=UPI00140D8CAD|nr:hypothetical protein [Diaphorobacter sp. HDW4A]QIL81769.1 hypothetical protein G7047_19000 [Diaphorobacter sp. HDW4A]